MHNQMVAINSIVELEGYNLRPADQWIEGKYRQPRELCF